MHVTARFKPFGVLSITCLVLFPLCAAHAQLADTSQVNPSIAGGGIAKSLEEQVGAGQGDAFTFGSSIYLIKRDPARSIRRGRQLFQRKFTANQGLGPRVNFDARGDIHDNGALGAGISDSCAGCHGRPRGSAGFGGVVATRPDSRDAPHLFGLGLIEMLADEITTDLRTIRADALAEASASGRGVAARLVSKGIDYGSIFVSPDGSVDTASVRGINDDLRVRPFFHDGRTISIREFVIGAFKDEMGLQASDPILCAATDPASPVATVSPAGMVFDPAADDFDRPPVCDPNDDADDDGITNEVDPALIDHMEFYLLNYFRAGRGERTREAARGKQLMARAECTACHIEDLTLEVDRRVADVDTEFDGERGIFNRLFATATTLFETVEDGDPFPQLLPKGENFVVRDIWTDFKRHDLGPAFHERLYDGSIVTEFITEPLWGVGSTPPYGHDGRSINLMEVILRHGGEAQRSRDRFARLDSRDRRAVIAFLNTLVLFPPDDTASNLNPGVPGTNNPQDPAEHGSILLPALFTIDEEGAE